MTKIQHRRGIASDWASYNPILASGEIGFETDTKVFKIGDGTSNWLALKRDSVANMVSDATPDAEIVTRVNLASSPHGDTGWHTSSGYGSTYDPNKVRPDGGLGARKYTKSSTDTGRYFPYGRAGGSATVASPSGAPVNTEGLIPVVPGASYGVGFYGMTTVNYPSATARFTFRWIDSAGGFPAGSVGSPNETNLTPNTWRWVKGVAVAPPTAAFLSIEPIFDMNADGNVLVSGSNTWMTMMLIEERYTEPLATEFFDGSYPVLDNVVRSWTGRPRTSTSKAAVSGYIAKRDIFGNLKVGVPKSAWEATPKSYVDAMTRSGGGFINVKSSDYGAKGDGVTSDQSAIQNALYDCELRGGGIVYIPAGTYIVTGLLIPSKVHLWGAGMEITTLLMKAGSAWNNRVITNSNNSGGNSHWGVYELTADGNQPNRPSTGGSGGVLGTNVSVVNSSYVWLNRVNSIRAMQHNFDITSNGYTYNGGTTGGDGVYNPSNPSASGVWSSTPSRYVWLSHCRAEFHGDDAFTTHGSEFIWFDHCWAGTTWKAAMVSYENTNGFEIDDGSRHIWLSHCYSQGNAHGFEIKAHGNVPAAFDVHLDHCVSYNDEISFSLRHIGHHILGQPLSLSAKQITLTSCTSLYPKRVFTGTSTTDPDAADEGNLVRALSIGGYRGVEIIGFKAIGDPGYDYGNTSIIVFEYFCEDILLSTFLIEGFAKCTGNDIYAKGGDQAMKYLTLLNGVIRDSAVNGMSCGSASSLRMRNVKLTRNVEGSTNGTGGFFYGNHRIHDNNFIGFAPNYNVSGGLWDKFEDAIPANVAFV